MAKILALSFFPAFLPPRSGGEVRLFGLYNALSRDHSVVLLTSGHMGQQVETFSHNARFREVRVPKDNGFGEAWAKLAETAGGGDLSAPALAAACGAFGPLHEAYLAEHADADVIIHDSPFLAGYDLFLGHDGKPRIYNSYNVEADIYRELHKDGTSSAIHDVVFAAEELLCRHADVVTVCSVQDGERFKTLFGYDGPIVPVPNGIDPFLPPEPRASGKDFVFIGSGHRPNRTAAGAIISKIAPAFPNTHFHILGTCMEAGKPAANVTAHGMVDDATKKALFASARAGLNPMAEGGGSSLKIADMAAHGVPLLSTEMGVRGFDYVADEHYVALDLNNPTPAIRQALEAPQDLARIAATAARHVAADFTWDSIARRMSECIVQATGERDRQQAAQRYLVLNDYDPFLSVGGGATRIRGLYEGVCESARIILLCFTESAALQREEVFGGRGLVLAFPKTAAHQKMDAAQAAAHHVSIVDILAITQAPANPGLAAVYRAAEPFCDLVLCEHPYMTGLPRETGARFAYSSQNFELGLKRCLLETHPNRDALIAEVADIERFSVGCSDLVVAVSQDDAEAFGAHFDLVAPTIVVPNGAEEVGAMPAGIRPMPGFNACFLGSAHMPNIESARFIIETLAPACPEITFHIAGSVSNCVSAQSANVRIWGLLTDEAKGELFASVQLAINPMLSGSGSNVKVADYLKNGLPVLTTEFGARGYEAVAVSDLIRCGLDGFASALHAMACEDDVPARRAERRSRFVGKLSMADYGRNFATALAENAKVRPKALFVTYRYNFPRRGGGEIYVNRLMEYLADAGFDVDVISPKVLDIHDHGRFSSDYPIGERTGAIPVGNARIRSAKFATAAVPDRDARLQRIWGHQPDFEEALFDRFALAGDTAALCWGWAEHDGSGRWSLSGFGIYNPSDTLLRLAGHVPFRRILRIEAANHACLLEQEVSGTFDLRCAVPAGLLRARVLLVEATRPADVRPLGLYLDTIDLGSESLIATAPKRPWLECLDPAEVFGAMHAAACRTRSDADCRLTDVRGPYSPGLEEYVANHVRDYDLVVTHNSVFRTATRTIAEARRNGVPSVLVAHAHFDDDYYHFPDIVEASRDASLNLISPHAACDHLASIGINNVAYHSPGIDVDEAFTPDDVAAFRAACTKRGPFILVLGRKSQAKNYRAVIAAVAQLRAATHPDLRVVMIGPDDDKQSVKEGFVDYLGLVDRSVIRGALQECVVLANMSTSESFGIVLLEAGLAAKPVLANAQCAAFADVLEDGVSGFLVTPHQLADRMNELVGNAELRERMGQAMRNTALRYGWDEAGRDFVAHCTRLAGIRIG